MPQPISGVDKFPDLMEVEMMILGSFLMRETMLFPVMILGYVLSHFQSGSTSPSVITRYLI